MDKDACYPELSRETLRKILDNIYNEVYVTDADMNILYVSATCHRHYGLTQAEMIGHNHAEFAGTYWKPTVLPYVNKWRRRSIIQHTTMNGQTIITLSNPAYQSDGRLRMIVSLVQDIDDPVDISFDTEQDRHPLILRRNNQDLVDIIANSASMEAPLALARQAAPSDVPILIQGESGTGKTMLARYIHTHSNRMSAPFLTINCASIPENLLESELFGYAPHAFTGANRKGKVGLIKLADKGTLFLDEIGELPPALQSKLLTVVDQQKFLPIGATQAEQVDIRIISATNKNLEQMMMQKLFREDLFWRLNVMDIHLPALVERPEDILPLANYYLYLFNCRYQTDKLLSPEVLQAFLAYSWPGNVRQLRNTVDRAALLSAGPVIALDDLPQVIMPKAIQMPEDGFDARMLKREQQYIEKLYAKHGSSRKLAAAIGVSQSLANQLIQIHCGGRRPGGS